MSGAGAVRWQLALLSGAIVLGMAPWFAATVVARPMAADLGLSAAQEAWLTLAVQLGFVLGSVFSAALLLSDRFSARRFAAASATLAALATATLAWRAVTPVAAIALRVVAGAALAGVYPPGIKMAAGWTTQRRGTAIGVLVGAVTLGSASPHLLRAAFDLREWRPVLLAAAASALASAALFLWAAREGPHQAPSAPFDPRAVGQVVRNRGVMLATGGYLGHMWELYAMWSSIGIFFTEILRWHGRSDSAAPLIAFAVIGIGAVGCAWAGMWADRIGRARVTIIAMAISATCALAIGPVSRASLALTVGLALVWGIAIVADSAQFSACVTELSPREYVGTAVTMQTALGFLLTMLTIVLVPRWAALWGWHWAYAPLAIGPGLGILAMRRLRI
jgi:MFS family permease